MSYAPIALTIPQYDSETLSSWWLKAYEQGTVTPLSMATDATAGTLLAKCQLDSEGFPITAGAARFIPFINGDYDLWLFPTESEADFDDTTNAIQFADNLNADPSKNSVIPIGNVAALKLFEGEFDNQRASLQSYYDGIVGGDQELFWDAASTETANDVTIFQVTGVITGRWKSVSLDFKTSMQAGAKADGVTDDTTFIQAALNAVSNVKLSVGTSIITSNLDMNSNQVIEGFGHNSILKLGANVSVIEFDNVSNVTIHNFQIDGNKTTYTGLTNEGIYGVANGNSSTDIEISNMLINNMGGAGILILAQTLAHDDDIRIIDNVVKNTGTMGIHCQDYVDNTLIARNHVEDFALDLADRPGITTGRTAVNHRVIDNRVICNPAALGVSTHCISMDNCNDFVCANNLVSGSIGYGIEIGGGQDGTVTGNKITSSTRAGIGIGSSNQDNQNVSVTGNTITDGTAQGIWMAKAGGTLVSGITLTGNTIKNNAQSGIEVGDTCEDITIIGNKISESGLSGIFVYTSDDLIIHGNKIKDNNTDLNVAHAGVRIANLVSETDMLIDGNRVTGSGITDYSINKPVINNGLAKIAAETFPLATTNPSIANGRTFKTADLTALTAFTGSVGDGDSFKILALHAATLVNGGTLKTSTGANKAMTVNVVYEFTSIGGIWYETATA